MNFNFNSFSLKKKLYISFGFILILLSAMSVYSLISLNKIGNIADKLDAKQFPSLYNVEEFHLDFINTQRIIFRINSVNDQSEKTRLIELAENTMKDLLLHQKDFESLPLDPDDIVIYDQLKPQLNSYLDILNQSLSYAKSGNFEKSTTLISDSTELFNRNEDLMTQLTKLQMESTQLMSDEAVLSSNNTRLFLMIATSVSLVFGIFIAIFIPKQVGRSLDLVSENSNQMLSSVNDMQRSVESAFTSANVLENSVTKTNQSLEEIVVSISQTAGNAENTASSVEEISAAIEEMSRSITGVADNANSLNSSTEQASSAIQEMAVSVQQVSKNAQNVSGTAIGVQKDALTGKSSIEMTLDGMQEISKVVKQASAVMQTLGKSSEEIGSIIEVIEDIADQTNLLALNAAIEAARAGDHGKGFAVVADEVRKLAERSAKATKEIADLINGIQSESANAISAIDTGMMKVDEGSKLAIDANRAIIQIVESIDNITQEINQITAATSEQAEGTNQIVKAVENVTSQANMVMQATREQSLGANEIVRGITHAREQVRQITASSREQSQYGQDVSKEMHVVSNQTKEVYFGAEEQAEKTKQIVTGIKNVVSEIEKLR